MTQQIISTASGSADTAPVAGVKINANFTDLYGGTSGMVYSPPGTGAVPTTVAGKLAQVSSVFDFMTAAQIAAVQAGTPGVAGLDVTAALKAAALTGLPLQLPAGIYTTSATIAFTNSLVSIPVDARKTYISCTNLTVPVATVQGNNLSIDNVTFTHLSAPVAGSGADGLQVLTGSYQINVRSNVCNYNDNGITVKATSSALWIDANNCSNNSSTGFNLVDPNYIITRNVATANGTYGYYLTTATNSVGSQMTDNLSYTNGSHGYYVLGTSPIPMNDVYMANNISSFDIGNGFFFNTFGANLQLANNFSEYCGRATAGNVISSGSVGYSFTANNSRVSMAGCEALQCASDGLYNGGADIAVSGGIYALNGYSSGYGIGGTNAGFTNVTGATLAGNVTGQQSTTPQYASFIGCLGVNFLEPPATLSALSPPAFAGNGSGVTNPFNIPCTVYITSSLVTAVEMKIWGNISASIAAASGSAFNVPPGAIIIPFYSGSPTWVWLPA
jgi:hypothetical protein